MGLEVDLHADHFRQMFLLCAILLVNLSKVGCQGNPSLLKTLIGNLTVIFYYLGRVLQVD